MGPLLFCGRNFGQLATLGRCTGTRRRVFTPFSIGSGQNISEEGPQAQSQIYPRHLQDSESDPVPSSIAGIPVCIPFGGTAGFLSNKDFVLVIVLLDSNRFLPLGFLVLCTCISVDSSCLLPRWFQIIIIIVLINVIVIVLVILVTILF
jgi:hypothetical protein